MKKHISIFELFARNTIYKILLVLVAMGTVQVALFCKTMQEWIPMDYYDLDFQAIEHYTLEYMVDKSNIHIFAGIAFVLITVILCWNGCNVGSKSSYTICRLQVTEKDIFFMQSVYNGLCYVLLWGAQIVIFLILSSLYVAQSANVTNQTVFLAYYRNDFMHSVLPLQGLMRWTANGFMLFGCSVSTAVFTYLQRRGKIAWSLCSVIACVLVGFKQGFGNYGSIVIALIIWGIAEYALHHHVLRKKED